jgi:hypothetical protein
MISTMGAFWGTQEGRRPCKHDTGGSMAKVAGWIWMVRAGAQEVDGLNWAQERRGGMTERLG